MTLFLSDLTASQVLDAVELWAYGFRLVRETGICVEPGFRVDGLLVPVNREAPGLFGRGRGIPWWDRPAIYGVEVKVSRSDFLRGLREGQFDRYGTRLGGLYLAAPYGIVRPYEVPKHVGYLTVRTTGSAAVCFRHPEFRRSDLDQETMWRLIWRFHDEYRKAELAADHRERIAARRKESA